MNSEHGEEEWVPISVSPGQELFKHVVKNKTDINHIESKYGNNLTAKTFNVVEGSDISPLRREEVPKKLRSYCDKYLDFDFQPINTSKRGAVVEDQAFRFIRTQCEVCLKKSFMKVEDLRRLFKVCKVDKKTTFHLIDSVTCERKNNREESKKIIKGNNKKPSS